MQTVADGPPLRVFALSEEWFEAENSLGMQSIWAM
jgi:hypothetical protein